MGHRLASTSRPAVSRLIYTDNAMITIATEPLESFVQAIFERKAAPPAVAQQVARSLVLANLRGHDSHGVIRVIEYVDWMDRGWIDPGGQLEVIADRGPVLMVDGHSQFGQVIGRQATDLAIAKAKQHGICALSIRNAAHLGRIGEFMEQAAEAGVVSFSWTNTHGGGVLAAPHGGREPRLSANPLAAGAPIPGHEPAVMDIATCTIAEGKLKVARAKGQNVPPGCIVNNKGEPTTDPNQYYTDPKGAILPVAGHKGYALALFADVLAGAVAGGSCSHTNAAQIANGWFAVFIDPAAFAGEAFYNQQVGSLRTWIKSCPTQPGFEQVLLPGEPEAATAQTRTAKGIPIETDTWNKLRHIADALNVAMPECAS
jgi:uncharacterized oxidoreductase